MRKLLNLTIAISAISVLAAAGSPAMAAAPEEGGWALGVFAGLYSPGPDLFDDSETFGFRVGYRLTEHVGFAGSLGFVSLESEDDEMEDLGLDGKIESDLTLIDLSVAWIFRPEHRFSFVAMGGIGGSFSSTDVELTGPGGGTVRAEDFEDDSFTVNLGLGALIGLGDRMMLRIMPRARYFENRDDDEVDTETTIALGWRF